MSEFSVQEAAFAGFRAAREHPKALVVWMGASIVVQLVVQSIVVGMAGPAMGQMTALASAMASDLKHADPSKLEAVFPSVMPAYLVILPLSLIIDAVLYAAMNRVVLRPAREGFGYFQMGTDELRQLALRIAIGLIAFAGLVVAFAAIGALGAVFAPLAPLGLLAAAAGLVFVSVRLSLAVTS